MTDNTPQEITGEGIRQAASESVREGVDIRAKVHDVTLVALKNRRFDRHGMREVVRAITEGAALGAEASRADVRHSLSEAFKGLDEALRKSAEAGSAALRQLAATGKDISDHEIKQTLANMKKLEDDFLSAAGQAADTASDKVKPELEKLIHTARQSGTETGKQVAGTMAEFAKRFSVASIDITLAGLEAASEFGTRFAAVASGILAGIADALAQSKPEKPAQPTAEKPTQPTAEKKEP